MHKITCFIQSGGWWYFVKRFNFKDDQMYCRKQCGRSGAKDNNCYYLRVANAFSQLLLLRIWTQTTKLQIDSINFRLCLLSSTFFFPRHHPASGCKCLTFKFIKKCFIWPLHNSWILYNLISTLIPIICFLRAQCLHLSAWIYFAKRMQVYCFPCELHLYFPFTIK